MDKKIKSFQSFESKCSFSSSKYKIFLFCTGSGGIGLAAIRVALAYGLEVFTTVSTPVKKKFIMDTFPQLKGTVQLKLFSQ